MKLYRKRAFYGLLKAFIYKKLMIFYVRKLSYIILKRKKYMTTTIISGIFLFLPIFLGILGVAIFSAKKNVESKNN